MCKVDQITKDYTCDVSVGFLVDDNWYGARTGITLEFEQWVFIYLDRPENVIGHFKASKNLDPKLPLDVYSRLLVTAAKEYMREQELTHS